MAPDATVPQDRGFKTLFATYAREAIACFVPDLVRSRGMPRQVQVLLQHEIPHVDLREPSRFLDTALVATFASGSAIVLLEHWSDRRAVDHPRMAMYVVGLALKHPGVAIIPIVFITDSRAAPSATIWAIPGFGAQTLRLRTRVACFTAADAPRLRRLARTNRVAAMMLALAVGPGVASAVEATIAFVRAPGTDQEALQLLPFIESLAKLTAKDVVRYWRALHQEPTMTVIEKFIEERLAQATATGKAEGKAEGIIEDLLLLVAKGSLSADVARRELQERCAAGRITPSQSAAALAQLG